MQTNSCETNTIISNCLVKHHSAQLPCRYIIRRNILLTGNRMRFPSKHGKLSLLSSNHLWYKCIYLYVAVWLTMLFSNISGVHGWDLNLLASGQAMAKPDTVSCNISSASIKPPLSLHKMYTYWFVVSQLKEYIVYVGITGLRFTYCILGQLCICSYEKA